MIGTGNDASILNSLIATTLDSIDGYQESAEATSDARLKEMFEGFARDRRQVVTDLKSRVQAIGGTPEEDGTLLAAAHRRFVDLKSLVTGRDDKAIINEVERGEDHIKHKFEAALQDTEVSADTRAVIETAYGSVRTGHDKVRDLKHSMEAASA